MKFRLDTWQANRVEEVSDRCEVTIHEVIARHPSNLNVRQLPPVDALTALANYHGLSDAIESEIKRSKRSGQYFTVLICDLYGIKELRDSRGPRASNRALCRFADIVRIYFRSIDTVARCASTKFAMVLPATGSQGAHVVKRRIYERLSADCGDLPLSIGVGIALYPEDGQTIATLLQAADRPRIVDHMETS